jgi:hypothetical protein
METIGLETGETVGWRANLKCKKWINWQEKNNLYEDYSLLQQTPKHKETFLLKWKKNGKDMCIKQRWHQMNLEWQ